MTTATPILRCISEGTEIVIKATEGRRTIAGVNQTFFGWINSVLRSWDANKAGGARPATPVKVYEMAQNATYVQMFTSLGVEKKNLCFTHDQIITFCEDHRSWLCMDGQATFFLCEYEDTFRIARV